MTVSKRKIAAIAAAVLVSACAANKGSDFSLEAAAKVQSGMTKDQVMELLGPPSHKSARVGDEVWVWANYNIYTQESRTATIIFVNGLVQNSPLSGKPVQ